MSTMTESERQEYDSLLDWDAHWFAEPGQERRARVRRIRDQRADLELARSWRLPVLLSMPVATVTTVTCLATTHQDLGTTAVVLVVATGLYWLLALGARHLLVCACTHRLRAHDPRDMAAEQLDARCRELARKHPGHVEEEQ